MGNPRARIANFIFMHLFLISMAPCHSNSAIDAHMDLLSYYLPEIWKSLLFLLTDLVLAFIYSGHMHLLMDVRI